MVSSQRELTKRIPAKLLVKLLEATNGDYLSLFRTWSESILLSVAEPILSSFGSFRLHTKAAWATFEWCVKLRELCRSEDNSSDTWSLDGPISAQQLTDELLAAVPLSYLLSCCVHQGVTVCITTPTEMYRCILHPLPTNEVRYNSLVLAAFPNLLEFQAIKLKGLLNIPQEFSQHFDQPRFTFIGSHSAENSLLIAVASNGKDGNYEGMETRRNSLTDQTPVVIFREEEGYFRYNVAGLFDGISEFIQNVTRECLRQFMRELKTIIMKEDRARVIVTPKPKRLRWVNIKKLRSHDQIHGIEYKRGFLK